MINQDQIIDRPSVGDDSGTRQSPRLLRSCISRCKSSMAFFAQTSWAFRKPSKSYRVSKPNRRRSAYFDKRSSCTLRVQRLPARGATSLHLRAEAVGEIVGNG